MLDGRLARPIVVVACAAAILVGAAALAIVRYSAASEYEKTDARLALELAGAVRAVEALGEAARARAVRLARRRDVQRALAQRDSRRRRELEEPGVSLEPAGERSSGRTNDALRFGATVVAQGDELGRVVVTVPIGDVERRTALAEGDRLAILPARSPSRRTVTVDGRRYRVLEAEGGSIRLAALAPLVPIEASIADRRQRIVLALLASLAAVVLLASLAVQLSRPSGRPLRRAADEPPGHRSRRRSRHAATLVGNALAAGHDLNALVPVILDSAVAVTGASGARLVADGQELARAGSVRTGRPPLVFALTAGSGEEAQLVLDPPLRRRFDEEAIQVAEWLAGRASIALQNAHLHGLARRLASTDELTQLSNRRHFDEALRAEVQRAERFGDHVAVVVADLDNFKEVNDRFGHDTGDLVLQTFADVIRGNVRDVDLPARYGGEEFTVLLPGTDLEGGRQLAERLRMALAQVAIAGGEGGVRVTSSFGVAGFPEERSARALLRAADRALYRAKAAGKNTVVAADGARAASE